MDLLCFCSVLCLLCLCARLFICALWSPAGKGLTSWLSSVVSNCEFVTFPLVSWVGCGTRLYRFLIYTLTYFNLKECHGLVCNMLMWHFLVLLNYFLQFAWLFYIHIAVFRFLPMVHNDKYAIYIMI